MLYRLQAVDPAVRRAAHAYLRAAHAAREAYATGTERGHENTVRSGERMGESGRRAVPRVPAVPSVRICTCYDRSARALGLDEFRGYAESSGNENAVINRISVVINMRTAQN